MNNIICRKIVQRNIIVQQLIVNLITKQNSEHNYFKFKLKDFAQ